MLPKEGNRFYPFSKNFIQRALSVYKNISFTDPLAEIKGGSVMHKDKMDMQTASKLETKLPSHCSTMRATAHHQQLTLLYKLLLLWEQESGRWDLHRDPAAKSPTAWKT